MTLATDRFAHRWGADALRDWPIGRLLAVSGRMFSQRFGEVLGSYGWVDRGARVVRVPIDRAKELLLEPRR